MKTSDFSRHLSGFLTKYLPGTLNVSNNTIASYRDTYKLFLTFWEKRYRIRPEKLSISIVTCDAILEFLDWLESERGCSISTRNQRLAALHSFFRHVQKESPDNLFEIQRILLIPMKKAPKPFIKFLTLDEVEILLSQPDIASKSGRRDLTLIALMYDSGARVQEIIDLQMKDIRLQEPSVVNLHGKGNKSRTVPIMKNTSILLRKYMDEQKCRSLQDYSTLFCNQQKQKLTRKGVAYILKKYVRSAYANPNFTRKDKITCHVLRHSRAAHMLQAGIPLIYIRDFLGHSSVTSTEIYARLNDEIKRKAIEEAYIDLNIPDYPSWQEDADLMDWLSNLV
ncbi:tyrosine-type recombinase/integrase [Sporomusa acidovorans]|nr:tyrosine-type recombinase/integrase [Sporomusa acidovorans]